MYSRAVSPVAQMASDRGPPYLHMTAGDGDGRVVQKFLSELLYSDLTLLSSVVCSIGTWY